MSENLKCDVLIIGGGIAGASAGYFLAEATQGKSRIILLERESQPGYHSTGRSAALFMDSYGNESIRRLTAASKNFLENPPADFSDAPPLTPRGAMRIARADQMDQLHQAFEETRKIVKDVEHINAERAQELFPALRPGHIQGALYEEHAKDMDVDAIHQGYLRGIRNAGGKIITDAEVMGIGKSGSDWNVETRTDTFTCPVVLNAAGAWADEIASMAGVSKIDLDPKRRTAMTFDPPASIENWVCISDIAEDFYIKPDAGKLLGSPADETPVPPQDVQPEELDIAIAVDRIQTATTLEIRRLDAQWAGLRSFVPDRTPVVGEAPSSPGFIWVAGQGGYGIATSPAMGRLAAAAALGNAVPSSVADCGVTWEAMGPDRLAKS